ncbi:SpaA isopeptide-forming pilin-related protein [Schleiferilactobacillus shenzhenensis]|uniref:SpaA-like prealbumin fold domain-containing protein n=1 Tax=Schleiferilactobacillus shenzhenensis LY-73 TaxID=1231336 RepID=U4TIH4_9LACO|nr:SpaA isopeptide-forming pilin-related protein [Schleiferilactobacillus shenzhenensis]ERL64611.1 hypothetical protein L248_0795 [Schleiferilactobacillus shenzhenensis LY-73]
MLHACKKALAGLFMLVIILAGLVGQIALSCLTPVQAASTDPIVTVEDADGKTVPSSTTVNYQAYSVALSHLQTRIKIPLTNGLSVARLEKAAKDAVTPAASASKNAAVGGPFSMFARYTAQDIKHIKVQSQANGKTFGEAMGAGVAIVDHYNQQGSLTDSYLSIPANTATPLRLVFTNSSHQDFAVEAETDGGTKQQLFSFHNFSTSQLVDRQKALLKAQESQKTAKTPTAVQATTAKTATGTDLLQKYSSALAAISSDAQSKDKLKSVSAAKATLAANGDVVVPAGTIVGQPGLKPYDGKAEGSDPLLYPQQGTIDVPYDADTDTAAYHQITQYYSSAGTDQADYYLTVRIYDGTKGGFRSEDGTALMNSDDDPGHDSSNHNGKVRTGDTMVYTIAARLNKIGTKAGTQISLPESMRKIALFVKGQVANSDAVPYTDFGAAGSYIPLSFKDTGSFDRQTLVTHMGTNLAQGQTFTTSFSTQAGYPNGWSVATQPVTIQAAPPKVEIVAMQQLLGHGLTTNNMTQEYDDYVSGGWAARAQDTQYTNGYTKLIGYGYMLRPVADPNNPNNVGVSSLQSSVKVTMKVVQRATYLFVDSGSSSVNWQPSQYWVDYDLQPNISSDVADELYGLANFSTVKSQNALQTTGAKTAEAPAGTDLWSKLKNPGNPYQDDTNNKGYTPIHYTDSQISQVSYQAAQDDHASKGSVAKNEATNNQSRYTGETGKAGQLSFTFQPNSDFMSQYSTFALFFRDNNNMANGNADFNSYTGSAPSQFAGGRVHVVPNVPAGTVLPSYATAVGYKNQNQWGFVDRRLYVDGYTTASTDGRTSANNSFTRTYESFSPNGAPADTGGGVAWWNEYTSPSYVNAGGSGNVVSSAFKPLDQSVHLISKPTGVIIGGVEADPVLKTKFDPSQESILDFTDANNSFSQWAGFNTSKDDPALGNNVDDAWTTNAMLRIGIGYSSPTAVSYAKYDGADLYSTWNSDAFEISMPILSKLVQGGQGQDILAPFISGKPLAQYGTTGYVLDWANIIQLGTRTNGAQGNTAANLKSVNSSYKDAGTTNADHDPANIQWDSWATAWQYYQTHTQTEFNAKYNAVRYNIDQPFYLNYTAQNDSYHRVQGAVRVPLKLITTDHGYTTNDNPDLTYSLAFLKVGSDTPTNNTVDPNASQWYSAQTAQKRPSWSVPSALTGYSTKNGVTTTTTITPGTFPAPWLNGFVQAFRYAGKDMSNEVITTDDLDNPTKTTTNLIFSRKYYGFNEENIGPTSTTDDDVAKRMASFKKELSTSYLMTTAHADTNSTAAQNPDIELIAPKNGYYDQSVDGTGSDGSQFANKWRLNVKALTETTAERQKKEIAFLRQYAPKASVEADWGTVNSLSKYVINGQYYVNHFQGSAADKLTDGTYQTYIRTAFPRNAGRPVSSDRMAGIADPVAPTRDYKDFSEANIANISDQDLLDNSAWIVYYASLYDYYQCAMPNDDGGTAGQYYKNPNWDPRALVDEFNQLSHVPINYQNADGAFSAAYDANATIYSVDWTDPQNAQALSDYIAALSKVPDQSYQNGFPLTYGLLGFAVTNIPTTPGNQATFMARDEFVDPANPDQEDVFAPQMATGRNPGDSSEQTPQNRAWVTLKYPQAYGVRESISLQHPDPTFNPAVTDVTDGYATDEKYAFSVYVEAFANTEALTNPFGNFIVPFSGDRVGSLFNGSVALKSISVDKDASSSTVDATKADFMYGGKAKIGQQLMTDQNMPGIDTSIVGKNGSKPAFGSGTDATINKDADQNVQTAMATGQWAKTQYSFTGGAAGIFGSPGKDATWTMSDATKQTATQIHWNYNGTIQPGEHIVFRVDFTANGLKKGDYVKHQDYMSAQGLDTSLYPISNIVQYQVGAPGVVRLEKEDAKDTTKKLAGAAFVLSKDQTAANQLATYIKSPEYAKNPSAIYQYLDLHADEYQLVQTPGTTHSAVVQTTDSAGRATFGNLDVGTTYYAVEVVAPTGYAIGDQPTLVTGVKAVDGTTDTTTVYPVKNSGTPTKVALRIFKMGADPKSTDKNIPLKGAEFQVFRANADGTGYDPNNPISMPDANGNAQDTFTTNGDGVINIDPLDPGSYYILETKAPEGYELAKRAYKVTLVAGKFTGLAANGNMGAIMSADPKQPLVANDTETDANKDLNLGLSAVLDPDSKHLTFVLSDAPQTKLPFTGGQAMMWFLSLLVVLLMITAVALIVYEEKRKNARLASAMPSNHRSGPQQRRRKR